MRRLWHAFLELLRRPPPPPALPAQAAPLPASDADLAYVLRHERFLSLWYPGRGGVLIALRPLVGNPVLFAGTLDHAVAVTSQILRDDRVDELAARRDMQLGGVRGNS